MLTKSTTTRPTNTPIKLLSLALCIAFIASTPRQAKSQHMVPPSDVIWDLTGSAQKNFSNLGSQIIIPPTLVSSGSIYIFRDTHFGNETACIFEFNSRQPTLSIITEPTDGATNNTIRSLFMRPHVWKVVNWSWKNSSLQSKDKLYLCDSANVYVGRTVSGAAVIQSHLPGKQNDAKDHLVESLTIGSDYVILGNDSTDYYRYIFGGAHYQANNETPAQLFQIINQYPTRRISEYSKLYLAIIAQLRVAAYEPGAGPTPGNVNSDVSSSIPLAASSIYNSRVNATRFGLTLDLRWAPKYCGTEEGKQTQKCQQEYNKPLEFLIGIYDNRWEYWGETREQSERPIARDPGTASNWKSLCIWRSAIRPLVVGSPDRNPFKVLGKIATAKGDILPMLSNAILVTNKTPEYTDCLPARLANNRGQTETDQQYVGDFTISGVAIGYENSALSDISYLISAFSLTGVPVSGRNGVTTAFPGEAPNNDDAGGRRSGQ
jgi:hypothetical protein